MTDLNERALEAAARAAMNAWEAIPDCPGKMYGQEAEVVARAAVTAYLAEAGDGRLSELERENARMREAMKPFAWQTRVSSLTAEKMILAARAALAGSGEK